MVGRAWHMFNSRMTDSGCPYAANSFRSSVTVLPAVVLFRMTTSSHFEWLSATTKNIFPFFSAKSSYTLCHGRMAQGHGLRGAAESTCTLCHGPGPCTERCDKVHMYCLPWPDDPGPWTERCGKVHMYSLPWPRAMDWEVRQSPHVLSAAGGAFLCREHSDQLLTISSMSLSIPGHHMKLRAWTSSSQFPGALCATHEADVQCMSTKWQLSCPKRCIHLQGIVPPFERRMDTVRHLWHRPSMQSVIIDFGQGSVLACSFRYLLWGYRPFTWRSTCTQMRSRLDSQNRVCLSAVCSAYPRQRFPLKECTRCCTGTGCIRAAAIDGISVLGPNLFVSGRWFVLMVNGRPIELLHTIDDSQCLTFDLGVVSLCGTQCSWCKCNGFFNPIWRLMADHSSNSIWACIRGKNEWLAFVVVDTLLHRLNAPSQALSHDHSTPAFSQSCTEDARLWTGLGQTWRSTARYRGNFEVPLG